MALRLFAAERDGLPLVGWHRGAGKAAPENTLAAFRYALEHGSQMVELDVQLSTDGEVVVIHDALLNRTTNGKGPVAHHTLAQLKQLDAGSWFAPQYAGERIPTLREVIELLRGHIPLTVELKHGGVFYPELEAQVVALLRETDMLDQVFIISFDHRAILRLKQIEPRLPAGIVYTGRLVDPVAAVRSAQADAINTHWGLLQAQDIATCHDAGIAVHGSIQNDVSLGPALTAMGIDMVDSDYPQELMAALREPVQPDTHAALLLHYLRNNEH